MTRLSEGCVVWDEFASPQSWYDAVMLATVADVVYFTLMSLTLYLMVYLMSREPNEYPSRRKSGVSWRRSGRL